MVESSKLQYRHYQFFSFLLSCFAFFLPLAPRLATLTGILLFLNWLMAGWPVRYGKQLFGFFPLLLYGFYLFLLLSLIYTGNSGSTLRSLETKMGLFFFPLLFFSSPPLTQRHERRVLLFFLAGCILACSYSLLSAGWVYFTTGEFLFFYEDLTGFLGFHPTYFGLYVSFCLFVIMDYFLFRPGEKKVSGIVLLVLSLFFLSFLVLLNSRMALLTCVALLSAGYLLHAYQRGYFWRGLGSILAALLLLGAVIWLIPQTRHRLEAVFFEQADRGTEKRQSNLRLKIWEGAIDAIADRPWAGYSPGDAQDVLNNYYEEESMHIAQEKKLNAHNEYLQLALAHGIPAALWLLLILAASLVLAFRKGDILFLFFLFFLLFAFLTESMLAVQRGTLFIAFFLSFFSSRAYLADR
jgi:O-antigen ligase